ncbi:TPA: DUF1642 domain-containing protein [Streptococcus suis]|nr:DUF1642 domain-containing protein [Streptococcus suis]HEL2460168.1 DUF1642 domain-containing protein [Streptococcus suis]
MNKQEAIERIESRAFNIEDTDLVVGLSFTKNIINQIDEQQKVVIPKFIADKIEYCKNKSGYGLFHAMDYCYQYKDSADWLECNEKTFAQAWFDGYEVEKEQLYAVKLVGTGQYLVERYKRQGYVFIETEDPLLFTKSELESAGFGGVFDNPMFEVEEVE